ncbi:MULTISPECIES: DMT family transporter [Rheinheimera]|uniref:DMT family transporter n=1 Tax=Rheinheimera marina TaxID=1774958 RepID=A0ABV9JLJ0_9GAMM
MPFEYLALLAACCWAIGSLLSAKAASHLGAFAFTRYRLACAATLLWLMAFALGGINTLQSSQLPLLAVSALVGILIGDTSLFASMNRLGPRRAGVLFATHAMFSVVLAYLFLGESIWGWTLAGCSLLSGGVMTAILFGRRNEEQHHWEADSSQLRSGIALGLVSAVCQAASTLMIKPLMETDIDAVAASAVRMTVALVAHLTLFWLGFKVARSYQPMNRKVFLLVLVNAALSMVIGMTLILQALKRGDAGLVGMLSSVSPVVVVPLLWLVYKRRPAAGAWFGAMMTVAGTVLILSSRH